MKTNKIQWKRISEGEELPCDSLLMRYDGTITRGTCAGVKAGQDAYYLPLDELKKLPKEESEDKKMIQYFEDLAPFHEAEELYEKYGFSHKEAIAWIEKQCEHKKFLDSIQVGDKVTRNEDGVLVNLSQLNRVAKKDEKQGEQRSKLVDFDLNAKDSDLQEETYFIPDGYHAEINGDKVVIKKGEQKSAGVEPKFKVGKWYLCVKDFWGKFVRFDKGHAYYCGLNGCLKEFDSGAHIAIDEKLYDYFNLWTIQDAKDGDVLVYGVNQRPFIFKGLLDPYHPNCPVAYCGIDTEGTCYISKNNTWWTDCNVIPATKEQRATLKKAMADAGYTFDFEKKELRKIEQKPEERESCEHWDDEQTRIKLLSFMNIEGKAKLPLTSVNRFVNYLEKQGKQKPWSEEDEKKLGLICEYIPYSLGGRMWLKNLKDRVVAQPKQEWSNEDEKMMNSIAVHLNATTCGFPEDRAWADRFMNWLKSIKDRYTWKPSERKIQSVADCTLNKNIDADTRLVLDELYQDLLKLR